MNFTYRKIVGHRGCYAKPRTQLRATARARATPPGNSSSPSPCRYRAESESAFGESVIDFQEPAVWRLLAAIVHDEWA